MNIPTIEIKTFYLWGGILMGISTIGNLWALKLNWAIYNTGNVISSIGGILFNLLLTLFFLGLYKITPKPVKVIDNPELGKLLDDLTKNDKEVTNEPK